MTESDIQSFYIFSSRHNGKIFTISAPVPNLISIEKKNDSTNKVEQKLEIPKSIYDRMLSIFDLTDQLSYILAHGQLEYRTHQAVIYGASEEMERDAASCVVIEDFIIDQNHYARLSFVVYNPDNYKRSVYFHMKIFKASEGGPAWAKKIVTFSLRDFTSLLIFDKNFKREQRKRDAVGTSSMENAKVIKQEPKESDNEAENDNEAE